eukprot:8164-Heterococcus_DN1.PRE.3
MLQMHPPTSSALSKTRGQSCHTQNKWQRARDTLRRCPDPVEIVWALPGKAACEFRRSSAQTVCRNGGDLSLIAEIEARLSCNVLVLQAMHHHCSNTQQNLAESHFEICKPQAALVVLTAGTTGDHQCLEGIVE